MNAYAQSADTYLVQRVLGAGPEQQAALLMEAGQKFIGKAIKALEQNDHHEVSRCLIRVTAIINEADLRLNREEGGELVVNLIKIYAWWTREVFEAGSSKEPKRLRAVSSHMGEIRQAWEDLHQKRTRALQGADFQMRDRVV